MPISAMTRADEPDGFPQPKRVSLAESIADAVAEAIATRRLLPGERIVELTLADQLGVSRVPIREALKVLHAHGILVGGSHRGYRVAEFGPTTAAKVFETRLMIETFLLRDAVAAWRAGRGRLRDLDGPIGHMEVAAKARDGLASLKADIDFHRTIRAASQNEIAATLWDAIARHVLIIFNQEPYRDKDLNAVVRQHKAFRLFIHEAVEAPEPPATEAIRAALEDHLTQIARRAAAPKAPRPVALPGAVKAAAATAAGKGAAKVARTPPLGRIGKVAAAAG